MNMIKKQDMYSVVTGGAGFIGSHLVDLLLKNGHHVCIIDNLSTGRLANIESFSDEVKFIEADLGEESGKWIDHITSADYIFHLASLADIVPSIEKPGEYFNANVISTLNILKNIRPSRLKKIVYAASSSCYGLTTEFPTSENAACDPQYPYALTKLMGEELLLHWCKVYSIPGVSTRFFNVYGTRSRTSGTYGAVFGIFLAQKLAGVPYTVVGDGRQKRDFTYVTDVCEGILQAAESEITNEVFNIGSGTPQSINRLVELLGGEVVYIPKRPGEPEITHADISKAKRLLGYSPKISFEEGVKRVLDEIDYWKEAPVWTPQTIQQATKVWFNRLGKV